MTKPKKKSAERKLPFDVRFVLDEKIDALNADLANYLVYLLEETVHVADLKAPAWVADAIEVRKSVRDFLNAQEAA